MVVGIEEKQRLNTSNYYLVGRYGYYIIGYDLIRFLLSLAFVINTKIKNN